MSGYAVAVKPTAPTSQMGTLLQVWKSSRENDLIVCCAVVVTEREAATRSGT